MQITPTPRALRCRSRCNTVYEISTGGQKVGKKLRGKGFTRVTKRRSCPARKKLKSGHKAGRGSWIGDRLAVGTKTGDRIGHGDDEVPRHWPRCGGNNGQRTSSGWPGDLVWQPGTRRTYATVLSTDPPLRPGRGAPRQKVGALLFQDSHDIPFRSRNNAKTIFFFFFFLLFFFSISHTFYPTVYDSFLRGEGGFSSIYSIENEKWKFVDMCRFDKSWFFWRILRKKIWI